jgi:hypothetical protein
LKGGKKQAAEENVPKRCAAPMLPKSHFDHLSGDGRDVQTRLPPANDQAKSERGVYDL